MPTSGNSPTGRLLRSSRLFSLPRPLPVPQLERPSAQGSFRASDTATLPYPCYQAITTPPSANFRGDWGLKRQLPAKATRRTSTPLVRVHQQDTYTHITDFASAADHVLSARKFVEMGVPMMQRPRRGGRRVSVYEEALDQTDVHGQSGAVTQGRWKSTGPWLAGMEEGDFVAWLKDNIDDLETASTWRKFVAERVTEKRLGEAQRRARDEGETISSDQANRLRRLLRPTESELVDIFKGLRDDHELGALSSDLTGLICDFLDIPGVAMTNDTTRPQQSKLFIADQAGAGDSTRGPPSTHPGAGLSYIKSGAYMENHPLYGPQSQHSPVLSRVLRTRSSTFGSQYNATLGVGGFVTADSHSGTSTGPVPKRIGQAPSADMLTHAIDPDLVGGNKIWMHADSASIDQDGRVELSVRRGDPEAAAVKTGDVQDVIKLRAAAAGRTPYSSLYHQRRAAGQPSIGWGRGQAGQK